MAIDLAGPTPILVKLALNAATLRHEVIANNIANINNAAYRPLRVSFEDQLSGLMANNGLANDQALYAKLETVKPEIIETSNKANVNQLDIEMINMAKNTLHYQTLLTGLKGYSSITKMAIKEGKL